MARIAIGFGFALVLLGVGAYFGSGRESLTALIPAIPGVLLIVLGGIGLDERRRKHAMHVAAALALLGFLGTVRGLMKLPALLSGEALERPTAVAVQSAMGALCLVFVLLCVWSFIQARRQPPTPNS